MKRLRGALSTTLTKRERELVRYYATGLSHQQIADRLNVTIKTPQTHIRNVMQKLDLHDRYAIILWAISEGLIPCPCGAWPRRILE